MRRQIRKRVEKVSSIEKIKTNVPKETGDAIRAHGLAGVKIDEDYKRYYPYDTLASKVLGFTGGDNQGIIGLEVKYDKYLQGKNGKILTLTDARGIEIENAGERGRIRSTEMTCISVLIIIFKNMQSRQRKRQWKNMGHRVFPC